MSKLKDIVSNRPALRRGLKIVLPAMAVVVLFAVGLLLGTALIDDSQPLRVTLGLADPVASEGSPDVSAGSGDVPARDMAEEPGEPGVAGTGTSGNAASPAGSSGGSGAASSTDPASSRNGPSDVPQAVVPPSKAEEPDPPSSASFLETNFGPGAAPESVAGMRRSAGPVMEGDTLEAEYAGGDVGEFDLLFLTVVKTNSATAARSEADGMLHSFPVEQIEYPWGGRQIRQAMTDEGRPNQFPPLICMVWTNGSFAVRVVTAPLAPDRVLDARTSTLDFIGALPY
jgi:hypothetical protein